MKASPCDPRLWVSWMPPTGANPEDGRSTSAFDPGEGPRWPPNSREIRRRTTSSRRGTPHWWSSTTSRARCRPSRRWTTNSSSTTSCRSLDSRTTFDLPVVLSTVNVANGQKPTIPELKAVLSDSAEIDRTEINSWENVDFRRAVEATGRKKLIMTALWTEVCLAFPSLDAMRDGYEVYPVVDAVGGTSPEAHRAGLERMVQAGAQPISWVSLACELQRDWARRRNRCRRRRHRADHAAARDRLNAPFRRRTPAYRRKPSGMGDVHHHTIPDTRGVPP